MAVLGMSKLDAVNEMLVAAGKKRVAALDTGGASDAADAESQLDIIDRRVQEMGWPENTEIGQPFTAATNAVTMASDTLWIRGSLPTTNERYVLRQDKVFDVFTNSSTITSGTVIVLDRIVKLAFADLAPRTKELICTVAATIFQRRRRGESMADAWLSQEQMVADMVADRVRLMGAEPINPYPLFARIQPSRLTQQGQPQQ